MEKTTFFHPFFSPWRKKLVSVPITLSLFVALSSMGEAMAAPEIGHSFSVTASQAVRVTGAVFDASGSPLIGVSVLEKGTSNGTITDMDGNFILDVSSSK